MTENTAPLSALDAAIAEGQAGNADPSDVVNLFLASKVYLPSASDFSEGSQDYHPLVYPRDDGDYVGVFSTMDYISEEIVKVAPYAALITGANAVLMLGKGVGLVVNPGQDIGFEIDPEIVGSIQGYLATLPQDDGDASSADETGTEDAGDAKDSN